MQIPKDSLFCLQDDADSLYDDNEYFYRRTTKDDEFDRQFIQKWDLELAKELNEKS